MKYHILKHTAGTKIPRPFAVASSRIEMDEILKSYCDANNWVFDRSYAGKQFFPENIDTDKPVLRIKGTVVTFYVFKGE